MGVGARDAEQVGDHQHGQRLGVPLDDVEALRVEVVEQAGRDLAHPRPQPLDVPARERLGDRAAQPGVRRRLVLHHLVAVQEVERLEVVERLLVGPDPAEPAVALHLPDGRVREGQVHPRRLVPGHRVLLALAREVRVGIGDDVGVGQVNRGRRDRTHRAAPRPSS